MGHEACCRVRLRTGGEGLGPQRSRQREPEGAYEMQAPPITALTTQPQLLLCPARFGPSSGPSLLRAGLFAAQIASWPTLLLATSRYPPGTAVLPLKTRL